MSHVVESCPDTDEVVRRYIETLLWSESCNGTAPPDVCDHYGRDEDCDMSLQSLDYDESNLTSEARERIVADVTAFVAANAADCAHLSASDIGYNFLLSRNGHGAGFWDRGWGDLGDRLHRAAKVYGPMGAYVGAADVVHVE